MRDQDLSEFKEGEQAFSKGKEVEQNPYPWTSEEWWRHEAWEQGHKQAEYDHMNDDYDD